MYQRWMVPAGHGVMIAVARRRKKPLNEALVAAFCTPRQKNP
jgi:hypothetical protein